MLSLSGIMRLSRGCGTRSRIRRELAGLSLSEVEVPIHGLVELRPAGVLEIGVALGKTEEGVHLPVQVLRVVQDEGFQALRPLGRPPFKLPVVAEDAVKH